MEKIKGTYIDSLMFKPSRLQDIINTVQSMLAARASKRTTSAGTDRPEAEQERSRGSDLG